MIILQEGINNDEEMNYGKVTYQSITSDCFFALFSNFKVFSQEIFIKGLEDIPIYSEMNYVEDSLILFDKINGRYVSTKTKGKYPQKEVQEFYKKILPNLGWKIKKKNLSPRPVNRKSLGRLTSSIKNLLGILVLSVEL